MNEAMFARRCAGGSAHVTAPFSAFAPSQPLYSRTSLELVPCCSLLCELLSTFDDGILIRCHSTDYKMFIRIGNLSYPLSSYRKSMHSKHPWYNFEPRSRCYHLLEMQSQKQSFPLP